MSEIVSFHSAVILNGESPVVHDFEMSVSSGDFVYIIGKVGTGKTSIIRTVTAENRLGGGEADVLGYKLGTIRRKDIPYLRRKIGVIFQDFQLLTDRNVSANLEFALRATDWKDKAAIDRRIAEVLDAVGMGTKAHKMPHQLSGGEQQRIAIARALLNEPALILADEPTGNLDSETAAGIMELLCELNRKKGTAIIMVTHDREIFDRYPGRVFLCRNERCEEQTAAEPIDISI